MAYILSEEGKTFVKTAKAFAEKEIKPRMHELEEKGEFPMDIYKKASALGLNCLEFEEEHGGSGLDFVTIGAMYEELGKIDAGFAVGLTGSTLAYKPVKIGGTPDQIKYYSNVIAKGGIGAFALTEPNAGSDAGAVATTAIKDGDSYVLNGRKCFITNGGISDILTVFASTDPSQKLKGLTCFMLDRHTPGVSMGKHEDKMGIRLSNTCDIVFEDVRIPAENLVGKEGQGFKLAMQTLDLARATLSPVCVGIGQRALEEAANYAKQRVQFGAPISALQAIQFMLADMQIRVETARQMAVHALTLADKNMPVGLAGAIAKCYVSDTTVQVCLDAIQIMGGYGYSREYPVEKLLRDAKIFQIFEGTNQIQRVVIAGHVLNMY